MLSLAALCAAWALLQASGNERQLLLLANTLWLAAGAVVVSLPLGTLLAVLVWRTDVPGRRVLLVLLAAMMFVPLYLQVAAWQVGLGRTLEISRGGLGTAIWIQGLALTPWVAVIVGAAIRAVEPELEEEALLWSSVSRVLLRVTLPRIAPAIGIAALWALLSAAAEMTVTDLFRVRTYAEELYTGFALGDEPSAVWRDVLPGVLLSVAAVLLAAVGLAAVPPALAAPLRPARSFRLAGWRWLAGATAVIVVFIIAGIPLANLLHQAGTVARQAGDMRWREWSAFHLVQTVARSPREFQADFGWTALIGVLSATVAVSAAIPLAWLARRGGWRALPALMVAAVGLATPGPLAGLTVIEVLNRPTPAWMAWLYDRTLAPPVLALLVRVLPIALLVCWHALRSVADDVLESAASEGAGPVVRCLWIAVPQRWAALGAAWLVAFAIAAGDLTYTSLVVPPGVKTVPIRVFGFAHTGVDDQAAGLCLTALAGYAAVAALACWLWSRWRAPTP